MSATSQKYFGPTCSWGCCGPRPKCATAKARRAAKRIRSGVERREAKASVVID